MFKSPLIAALGAVFALSTFAVAPAQAKTQPQSQQQQEASDSTRENLQGRQSQSEIGGRTGRVQRGDRNNRRAAEPTPEENITAAQAIAVSAAISCQVSQANFLGQTADGAKSYEAVCATGPGYILISSTPPLAVDCVLLAGQAEIDRARDPAADVGSQCAIPQNTDVVRVVSVYATEAGVPCAIDQAASIGKSSEGNLIYEVGCNGVDGYWIEKLATSWKTTECALILAQNATCRFSTTAEQLATFKGRLTGSDAAACDPTQFRYMGANPNGAFWEAKCSAGNGVIVRFDTQYAVQQVYPCETAQRIGGGCQMTIVPPPAEPAAEPAPATQQ